MNIKQEVIRMTNEITDELQEVRNIVMSQNSYGRQYEKALRKYDELAIRLDQMKRVLELF